MYMRMVLYGLTPGVQDAKKTYIGSEVPGVASHLEHGFGAGRVEQIVEDSLVAEYQRREFMGKSENDVEVGNRQQLCGTRLEPLGTSVPLALWAVPVATRVIRDGLMSASDALIAMSAQSRSAAAHDGIEHLAMRPGKM
jgi:hypothetical protein